MNRRTGLGIFLWVSAFAVYLHGAYPTVSVGDSGEFVTAGHTLGIPHAPGYPAYVILAHSAEQALPWANIGYRTNLFSAFCMALSVVLLFMIVCRIGIREEWAVCAALIFMLSPAVRTNAQASEVFALHAVFCGAVLLAAFSSRWRLCAFLLGLGLGNHQTLLFFAPAIGIAYMMRPAEERGSIPAIALCLAAGLSIYLFLYIRAAQNPTLNAGDPDTLDRLWRVFRRADYGSLTLALGETPPRNIHFAWMQLTRFMNGLADQVTWAGMIAGLLGAGIWLRKQPLTALTLLAAFLLIGPFFFLLGNLPFDAQSNGLLERFFIAPAFCFAILAAIGFQVMANQRRWAAALVFILPLSLVVSAGAFPLRGDFRAYAYGRNNLRTLPPNALFLMDGGDDTFYTLAYLRHVEGRRSDIELHDRGGVVFPGFYGDDYRQLTREEKELRRAQVERAAFAGGRVIYYSTMNEAILPGVSLNQQGLLYGSIRRPSPWPFYDLTGVRPWNRPESSIMDYRTRALLPFYAYQRSVELTSAGDTIAALQWASAAQFIGPDVIWLIPNIMLKGYFWAQTEFNAGRTARAEAIYRQMLYWKPGESAVWANLGAVQEKSGRLDAAIASYQKAIELDPDSEAAHYNLAVAYWKLNQWPKVIAELNRVLALNPANTAARNYLAAAQARMTKP